MTKFLLNLFFVLLVFPLSAQQLILYQGANKQTESYFTVADHQRDKLYDMYYKEVGKADDLLNGKDYFPYYNRSEFKPILMYDKYYSATLFVNGRVYSGISLEYDIYLDQLVFTDSTRFINYRMYQIALNKDPIEGFNFYLGGDSLVFKHFRTENESDFNLPDGIYELVYDKKSQYIIKHQTSVHERNGIDEYFYTPADYVRIEDAFTKIRTSKSFLRLFGDRSEEIKTFIHKNNIKIGKADKKQISAILDYFDNLK